MRVLGIDPGSKSLDICGLCDGEICFEASVDTAEAARKPEKVLEKISEFGRIDLLAAPSGYGVGPVILSQIPLEVFEEFYYTFILASTKDDINSAIEAGVAGARIYHAMAQITRAIRVSNIPSIFIPGVINLPTVPLHRKINRVDLGTADKLAVVALGIEELAREMGAYEKVNYIHVEMGYGYNAVIAVRNGVIVDGVGGTLMPGPAYLTAGSLDLEVAQAIGSFGKHHVFTTGCASITGSSSIEEWVSSANTSELHEICLKAMLESVIKAVYQLLYAVRSPSRIILSGRVAKIPDIYAYLSEELERIAPVVYLENMKPKSVKETAYGYAVVADGLAGGVYRDLVKHMEIPSATGSSLDYIVVKDFFDTRLGRSFVRLRRYLRGRAFNEFLWRSTL